MSYEYSHILKDEKICNFDFASYYYKRGKLIKQEAEQIPTAYPFSRNGNISLEIDRIRNEISTIILDPRGYQVFWFLNAIEVSGHSALDEISRIFLQSNRVVRGGINTYKLSGWMAHVLYVYQIVTHNIPTGMPPTFFKGKDEVCNTFQKMQEVYMKLSPKFKVIISVYALIHDIGVIDGVQRHDLDGEKYVEQILEDLELTEEFWNQYSITFGEAIRILKVLVTNHTLINKISAEDSDRSIADRCTLIIKKLGNVAQSISLSDLPTCYYLLGMADLIAVDDSLYTLKKYYLATNSYVYLESLFSGMPVARDLEQVALLRLGEMVNETTYSDIKNETKSILKQEDIDYHTFCEYLYQTYRLEYGTTYLKPLNSLKYTILSLYKLMSYVAKTFGTNKLSYLVIAFDATINFSKFKTAIEDGEYFYDIDTLSEQVLNVQSNNVSISYSTDTNRLSIATA